MARRSHVGQGARGRVEVPALLCSSRGRRPQVLPPGRALSSVEPERYRDEVVWRQLTDVVETYEPDDVYADSEWDWNSDWWKSRDWLAWLFNDSPVRDRVTVNDRWGNDTRGHHGTYFVCEYAACTGDEFDRPWTKTLSINSRFGYFPRADLPKTGRGDAAAATWIFQRRVAATPRLRRGYSVETRRTPQVQPRRRR